MDIDQAGIAVQLLSPSPIFFLYWDEPERALTVARAMNDSVAQAVASYPDRFLGLATVPLQDTDLALRELCRAMDNLSLTGVEIGSHIDGRNLDDPALDPFFSEVESRGIPVQVHPCPHGTAGEERMTDYHLRNLVGNPVETTLAVASVILGGLLEKHPGLRIAFAHGGGFAPYQIGRWDHAYAVRQETRQHISRPPSEYLRQCWFDTIVHSDIALQCLVAVVGSNRVQVGTDYPADMSDLGMIERVSRVMDDSGSVRAVLSGNARDWLGIDEEIEAT
jgi:aminocarboxymuconate-semialdehyde decarboxylase